MKPQFIAIAAVLVLIPLSQSVSAESVPAWVKNNAGWWADGTISESEFVSAIQHLIKEDIIVIPPTTVSTQQSDGIPDWVKNTALWWSQDAITDGEFVSGIQHLIITGVIPIESPNSDVAEVDALIKETPMASNDDSELSMLEADLTACSEIKKAYERLNCERDAKAAIVAYEYKTQGQAFQVGPMIFYYNGNNFEVSSSGQALLEISMLAENTGTGDNITMMCTGPSICNYDVWNGVKAYKYSGMDFTNGQIVLKPGEFREFTMLFGPNIGYGGTEFEYDSSKDYVFRILEPWGSVSIPLEIG